MNTPEIPARTNDVLIWLVPLLTSLGGAVGGWLLSWLRHGRELERQMELARAREEGRAEQLAEERRQATARLFERLERNERISESVRAVLVEEGLMEQPGTQVGPDGRGAPNPLRRPPPTPRKP